MRLKKQISIALAATMTTAMCACGNTNTSNTAATDNTAATNTTGAPTNTTEAPKADAAASNTTEAPKADAAAAADVKVGFIFLHDENSTYDLNFINAAKESCEGKGVEYLMKTNIPEGQECYEAACELADAGCDIVFADSFGHEDYMIEAAKEYPEVQFCHATGTKAHTENLENYHNAFATIYEGRYLAGIVAGMKLNEMVANGDITEDQCKMGYVGAFTYAEVI